MAGSVRALDQGRLIGELSIAREKGLGELDNLDLPNLSYAAKRINPLEPSIDSVIRLAINELEGETQQIAANTFGAVGGAELWTSARRRSEAAAVIDREPETIRRHYEPKIFRMMAISIMAKVDVGWLRRTLCALTRPLSWVRAKRTRQFATIAVAAISVIASMITIWPQDDNASTSISGNTIGGDLVLGDKNVTAEEASTPSSSVLPRGDWGPERQMFTIQNPAPYPVFNSIIDNPNYGDERNFALVRPRYLTDPKQPWVDEIDATPGTRYVFRILVENSGADNYGVVPAGDLQNARVYVAATDGKKQAAVWAYLDADNSIRVHDGVTIRARKPFRVVFDSGTANISNNAHPKGISLSHEISSEKGAPIGYKVMDGIIKPGYQYAVLVTIQFSIEYLE